MAIHSNMFIRVSDQAEVIQMFLDLMIERDRAGGPREIAANPPAGPHSDSHESFFPGELPHRD